VSRGQRQKQSRVRYIYHHHPSTFPCLNCTHFQPLNPLSLSLSAHSPFSIRSVRTLRASVSFSFPLHFPLFFCIRKEQFPYYSDLLVCVSIIWTEVSSSSSTGVVRIRGRLVHGFEYTRGNRCSRGDGSSRRSTSSGPIISRPSGSRSGSEGRVHGNPHHRSAGEDLRRQHPQVLLQRTLPRKGQFF
jgi:hypothetical protein